MAMKDFKLSPAFRHACREDVQQLCGQRTKKYVFLFSTSSMYVLSAIFSANVFYFKKFCDPTSHPVIS